MAKNPSDLLTIGEIAKRSDVSIAAVRFYEAKGLIESIRTNGNQRRYMRHILRKVALIKVSQQVGISLAEIFEIFEKLPRNRIPNREDWEFISLSWKAHLQNKIDILNNLQNQLDTCIGCGCLSLTNCPLRNPDDQFSVDPEAHPYWEESK